MAFCVSWRHILISGDPWNESVDIGKVCPAPIRSSVLTADTAHLTLGGGDALHIIRDYSSRIRRIALERYLSRGTEANNTTPTQAEHPKASLYHNLGSGAWLPPLSSSSCGRKSKVG